MNLGHIVHFHRKAKDLTRLQLSQLSGVGKTAIFDLEHGKKSLQWNTILAILSALDIEIRYESPLMTAYEASLLEEG